MPMIPPPPPLTKKQFDDAIKRGARTMREIDPALAAWADRQSAQASWRGLLISFGIAGLIVLAVLIAFEAFR